MSARVLSVLAFVLLIAAVVPEAFAAKKKDDVVEFGAGSRLIGELKRLERGRLYFDTDATDTIPIDWEDVAILQSSRRVRVENMQGDRYLGLLVQSGRTGYLAIVEEGKTISLPMAAVVNIDAIEETVWSRTDLDVSVGYSFTKSTGSTQWNAAMDLEYESETRFRTAKLSSQSTGSDEEEASLRHVLRADAYTFRDQLWLSGWVFGAEQNDALDLDSRLVAGYAGGRRFFWGPSRRVMLLGGVLVNQEQFAGRGSDTSLETFFNTRFDWYRFKEPELDLSTTLTILPSLTEFGRVRSALNISLKWEMFKDVFWDLSFFSDFDSDPRDVGEGSPTRLDYGITTGVGWSH